MKEAIILEKSEYKRLTDRIEYLESRVDSLEHENENLRWDISVSSYAYEEIRELKNTIWELRNRADIDAFNEASDIEFYDWASEMADKYEAIDDKEWLNEIKGRYCVNYREWMDNEGKYHIISFKDEVQLLGTPYGLKWEGETHGWQESDIPEYFKALDDLDACRFNYFAAGFISDPTGHSFDHFYVFETSHTKPNSYPYMAHFLSTKWCSFKTHNIVTIHNLYFRSYKEIIRFLRYHGWRWSVAPKQLSW